MREDPPSAWRSLGLLWTAGEADLAWADPRDGRPRTRALPLGAEPALTVGADRRCLGVVRGRRRLTCPDTAPLPATARSAQCAGCTAWDRSRSVAADTRLDDPRTFAVYLAHHGEMVKVGITAVDRGVTRLLEQGAFASTWLSSGSLASARRTENLVSSVLGLPDRVATVRKRRARAHPGGAPTRAADLTEAAERARALTPWPEGQTRMPANVADHTGTYGLPDGGLRPVGEVGPLSPGDTVAGRVVCRVGGDLYLESPDGLVLLDTRLLSGWAMLATPRPATLTAPLARSDAPGEPPPALF